MIYYVHEEEGKDLLPGGKPPGGSWAMEHERLEPVVEQLQQDA